MTVKNFLKTVVFSIAFCSIIIIHNNTIASDTSDFDASDFEENSDYDDNIMNDNDHDNLENILNRLKYLRKKSLGKSSVLFDNQEEELETKIDEIITIIQTAIDTNNVNENQYTTLENDINFCINSNPTYSSYRNILQSIKQDFNVILDKVHEKLH